MSRRHWLSLAGFSFVVGVASCREPTQITVEITTDTACPSEPLSGPRLVDVMFASGIKLDPESFVEVTTTSQCTEASGSGSATVGTLVLLPNGDSPNVEVLVVAGVELANPNAEVSPLRLDAGACRQLIEADGVGAIGGKPCILARRRLGFVDHVRLALPVDLDSRCIGKKCGEDETCFKGNCIPIEVECDANGCKEPQGCEDDCDEGCPSGTGRCKDSACECLPCDPEVCGDACELVPAVGSCSEDDLCLCKQCDQAACTDLCDGSCNAEAKCECGGTCDPAVCAGSGADCSCVGAPETCECIVTDCMPDTCAQQPCDFGERGLCGMNQGGEETCTCTCNDDECAADCPQGGSCANGSCNCSLCDDNQCATLGCPEGKLGSCYDGGCACLCEEGACDDLCGAAGQTGSCSNTTDPTGECSCSGGGGGAPPVGGGGANAGGNGGGGATGNGGGTTTSGGGGAGGGGTSQVCADYDACPSAPCVACNGNQGITCGGGICGCAPCSNIMAINCPGAKVWGPGGICECCDGLAVAPP